MYPEASKFQLTRTHGVKNCSNLSIFLYKKSSMGSVFCGDQSCQVFWMQCLNEITYPFVDANSPNGVFLVSATMHIQRYWLHFQGKLTPSLPRMSVTFRNWVDRWTPHLLCCYMYHEGGESTRKVDSPCLTSIPQLLTFSQPRPPVAPSLLLPFSLQKASSYYNQPQSGHTMSLDTFIKRVGALYRPT